MNLLRGIVFLVGCGMVISGLWMIYPPIALLCAGGAVAYGSIRGSDE